MTLATEPKPKRWTKAEYHSLLDWAGEDRLHYELIQGEIIQMPPQKDEHSFTVSLVDYALRSAFARGHVIKVQSPFDASATSEPEPDLMVVKAQLRDLRQHPKRAVLLVEVSLGSLVYDRNVKSSLYASCGVPDYWIINLVDSTVEVYRRPKKDAAARFGFAYGQCQILKSGERISPLGAPRAKIKVADLLP
jgi:Uma2 family endonuclease